jgi:ParB family transcriptional regulator, chromosome partitioning protein
MDLEFHQIDYRYEALRQRDPHREQALAISMDIIGQQSPVVVVPGTSSHILVDGFKRVRALRHLRHNTVRAITWDLEEREALLLGRLMRSASRESPLEQAWLLDELRTRFRMTLEELAHRFDRTPSWVSRRLALARELPEPVHEAVRKGQLTPHAAMKVLVPLARAKRSDCLPFLKALLQAKCSTRQAEALYAGWTRAGAEVRGRILADPVLFLRALAAAQAPDPAGKSGLALLLEDLGEMGRRARRGAGRIQEGVLDGLLPGEAQELEQALHQVQSDWHGLLALSRKEADCA